ncbi:MAG: Gfo/Idh/MocA family oxidoreductase [Verrucomicrobiota bacterium]
MKRRSFTQALAGSLIASQTAYAQNTGKTVIAVITNAEGAHLSAYFPALAQAEDVDSVVLSDPSGKTIELARKHLGDKLTATYTDPAEMLEKEQAVMALVSLEAAIAPPAINLALDAGCHVMAEKPACLSAEEFAKLTKKANDKKLLLMLALANRLNPESQEAKRIIGEGLIGKIYGMELHLIADQTRLKSKSYHKKWYAQKDRGGGGHLIWLGIHWLDLAMYLTQSKITDVAGFAGNVGGQPLDVEDSAALAIKFDNGSFGTVTSGFYLDKGYHSHIKIWGSDGWLEINRHGGAGKAPLRWYSSKGDKPDIIEYLPPDGPQGYSPFVAACVRAAIRKGEAPLTANDSLQVLKTVYGAYRAAETGQSQHIR